MVANPLLKLQEFGQSVWLDYIHRNMLASGFLKRLIEADGLRGVTSNPAASYLQRLPELGIDLNRVTQQLEDEGVEKFVKPYDSLMETLAQKC